MNKVIKCIIFLLSVLLSLTSCNTDSEDLNEYEGKNMLLYEKKAIIFSNNLVSNQDTYIDLLKSDYKMQLDDLSDTNLMISYPTIGSKDDYTYLFEKVYENEDKIINTNVIIIDLCINDFIYSSIIGNVDDNTTRTFYGALNTSIQIMKSFNENLQIIIMTPTYQKNTLSTNHLKNKNGNIILDYRDALMQVANNNNLYLVDNYYLFDVKDDLNTSEKNILIFNNLLEKIINLNEEQSMINVYEKLLEDDYILNPKNVKGKKFVFYGDSITARTGIANNEIHFTDILKSELGIEYSNYGIGGTTYGKYNSFAIQQIPTLANLHAYENIKNHERYNKDADYAILLYGTNDYYFGIEMGEIGSKDVNTFTGGMQLAIDELKRQVPNITIIVTTPIARQMGAVNRLSLTDDIHNIYGYTIEDYTKRIIEVAKENDLYICLLDRLFETDEYNLDVALDPVHPNVTGNRFMGEYLIFNVKKANMIQ